MKYLIVVIFVLTSCSNLNTENIQTVHIKIDEIKDSSVRKSFLGKSLSINSLRSKNSSVVITERSKSGEVLLNGNTLHATTTLIRDSIAFIGYQFVGDKYSGVTLILNITDNDNPEVKNIITYENADVRHLYFSRKNSKNYLFVGGASFQYEERPAFVAQITLNDSFEIDSSDSIDLYDLPSYGVTGFVQKGSGNTLYISSGFLNSAISTVDIPNKTYTESVIIDDMIRTVSYETSGIYVLTDTHLKKYDKNTFSETSKQSIYTDSLSTSFSQMQIYGSSIVTSQGAHGVKIYSLNDLSLLDSIPQVDFTSNTNWHPQLKLNETITNDAKVFDEYLFTANGGAGVHVYKYDSDIDEITTSSINEKVGSFIVENGESVNSISYSDNTLVVAAGSGGYYILSLQY